MSINSIDFHRPWPAITRLPLFFKLRDVSRVKTLFYNLKYGNLSCPFIIYPKVHVHIHPSAKILHNGNRLRIGFRWDVGPFRLSEFILMADAVLEIHDSFDIHTGCSIFVGPGAKLSIGKGGMNTSARVLASESITLGNNVYISDHATLRDSDGHPIGASSDNFTKPIKIGSSVLIGMNATVLKGVTIGDGAVVAANSLVNRSVPPRALVGGVPARVMRENIQWKL